jgi:hypothetical protein
MARTCRPTLIGRLRDRMMTFMLRRGAGPPGLYLLTLPGRQALAEHPLTAGGYFDVSNHSRLEGFTAEAGKHPVFGLDATGS